MIKGGSHLITKGLLLYSCIVVLLLTIWPLCDEAPCDDERKVKPLTLEDVVQEALKNNTLIREALELEKASFYDRKIAVSDLLPKVTVNYDYARLKETPYAVFGMNKLDVGPKNNFYWDVTVSQPIFTGFALETKKKIAELGVVAKTMEKERAVLDVAKRAKLAYFRVLLSKRFVNVARDQEMSLKAHMKDAESFYGQGLIPQNDLLKSQVAYGRAQQELVAAESNLEVAVASLNTVLRRPFLERIELEDVSGLESYPYDLSRLLQEARENRPELKIMAIAIKQAELGERVAKSGYYPKVYLVGQYKQQGEDVRATENDFQNSYNASISVNVNWPVFEFGKTSYETAKVFHERLALVEKMKGLEDSITLEVKDAFEKLKVAEKNITTAEHALQQAEENQRITNLQYQQQITTSTEVLDAQTYLTQARVNYYNALYGYYIAKAELERSVGKK